MRLRTMTMTMAMLIMPSRRWSHRAGHPLMTYRDMTVSHQNMIPRERSSTEMAHPLRRPWITQDQDRRLSGQRKNHDGVGSP